MLKEKVTSHAPCSAGRTWTERKTGGLSVVQTKVQLRYITMKAARDQNDLEKFQRPLAWRLVQRRDGSKSGTHLLTPQ